MKTVFYLFGLLLALTLMLVSCDSKPSLQKYFVEKSGSADFVSFDLGTGIIKTNAKTLTKEEQKALESVQKLNVLIYKKDSLDNDNVKYSTETKAVKNILKSGAYEELMRFGSSKQGASINMLGEGDDIDEFVVYLHQKENGFSIIRVLGDQMSPNNILTLVGLIKKSGIDMDQLKPALEVIDTQDK